MQQRGLFAITSTLCTTPNLNRIEGLHVPVSSPLVGLSPWEKADAEADKAEAEWDDAARASLATLAAGSDLLFEVSGSTNRVHVFNAAGKHLDGSVPLSAVCALSPMEVLGSPGEASSPTLRPNLCTPTRNPAWQAMGETPANFAAEGDTQSSPSRVAARLLGMELPEVLQRRVCLCAVRYFCDEWSRLTGGERAKISGPVAPPLAQHLAATTLLTGSLKRHTGREELFLEGLKKQAPPNVEPVAPA